MKYANHLGYSDVNPYEVIRVISDKTLEIREMNAERDDSVKLEFHVGGFSAHCSNQRDQKPEALRLADILESWKGVVSNEAAAELRRLHEVNAELLNALTTILDMALMDKGHWAKTIEQEAHTAITKATGEQR